MSWQDMPVHVLGDAMVDVDVLGNATGVSAEEPGAPVVRVGGWSMSPGGAAKAAVIMAKLGARPTLFGVVGADSMGGELRRMLWDRGVTPELVSEADRPTTVKVRLRMDHGTIARWDHERHSVPWSLTISALADALRTRCAQAILVSDYGKGLLRGAGGKLVQVAREGGRLTVLDPKDTLAGFGTVDAVTPNQSEWARLFGSRGLEQAQFHLGQDVVVARTLGAEGAVVRWPADASGFRVVAEPCADPATTVGAGDAFAAGFTLARAAGASWIQAAGIGNQVAGLLVRGRTISMENLEL